MESRWSDTETSSLDDLDLLMYQSRLIGADPSLVVWGGGNTSLKVTEQDFQGRETKVLRVKGSGSDMKFIQRQDFPALRMDDLLPLFERTDMTDEEMVEYQTHCLLEPNSPRPSIETLLHAFLPFNSVAHSHADAILSLTNNTRAKEVLTTVYGRDVAVVEYRRPGFFLSKEVALAALHNPRGRGVVLLHHGLVTWGTTPKEAYETHIELVSKAEEFIQGHTWGKPAFGGLKRPALEPPQRHQVAAAIAPTLRGLISQRQRNILHFDDSPKVLEFVNAQRSSELSQVGPATPDHLLQTKRLPLWLDVSDPQDVEEIKTCLHSGMEEYTRAYREWFRHHSENEEGMLDSYPRVILLPGVGVWTTGRNAQAAFISGDIYYHTIDVIAGAQVLGDYTSLSPKEAYEAEYWPLELYKLTLAPLERELARRIALVTGAASGIGQAIARRLAAEGAHMVVTDIDLEGAELVAQELNTQLGPGRATSCQLDVTSQEEVSAAFQHTRLTYGGLDIIVSNAGVASAGALDQLPPEEWARSLAINTTGHWLVTREAVRLMREQGLGGSVVLMGTKNVTAPGKEFGAYSVSKAAAVQLARVLAIENGEYGIRVNVINPDAVFRDSKLWSPEIREQRARAHGISVEDLEEFYGQRNLLKTSVTAEDVAEAALYFASDRSAKTTGAMLPVDGGLREAFPR